MPESFTQRTLSWKTPRRFDWLASVGGDAVASRPDWRRGTRAHPVLLAVLVLITLFETYCYSLFCIKVMRPE